MSQPKTIDEHFNDAVKRGTKSLSASVSSAQSSLSLLWFIVLCGLVTGAAYSYHLNLRIENLERPQSIPQIIPEQTYTP